MLPATSFLDTYLAYCGESEVPRDFNYWAGISLLAAAMSDHVWFEKMPGQRLVPNLYVVLVGPSGLGKGQAINRALGLSRDTSLERNIYSGKTSGQFLADRLAGRTNADEDGAVLPAVWMPKVVREQCGKLFLVTEELGLAVGSGTLADGFVKYMTGLYTGSPLPFSDGTRTRGEVKVKSYCINWLAGSTEEWLIRSISQDAIEGGFFGRTVVIGGKYDFTKRIVRPQRPTDYELLEQGLRAMLAAVMRTSGCFGISSLAAEAEDQWYEERSVPEDERMLAGWKRQHDLVLKLSMVLAMSDHVAGHTHRLQIDSRHMIEAQRLAAMSHQPIPKLITISNAVTNRAMRPLIAAERYIQKYRRITHRKILQMFGANGMHADELKIAVSTLHEQGRIEVVHVGKRKAVEYWWLGKGFFKLAKPFNGVESDDEDVAAAAANGDGAAASPVLHQA